MANRFWCLLILLTSLLPCGTSADETAKPADFTQVVVHKAIEFMPAELKTKLEAVESQITAGAKSKSPTGKPFLDGAYFVEMGEGSGLLMFIEQFRLLRKGVVENASYSELAPVLGHLAACGIAICQPYHTDEMAYREPAHKAFESKLDTASSSLKAGLDEYKKVDDPAEFGTRIAKQANELLRKIREGKTDEADIQSAVFSLAANSVADCWWTLLPTKDAGTPQIGSATGKYIGNKRSLKFHLPSCRYPPAEKNRVYFDTREAAINAGFVPCKVCKP